MSWFKCLKERLNKQTTGASMAKAKAPKQGSGIPQKHLHSRISYLSEAATYLALADEVCKRPLTRAKDTARHNHTSRMLQSSHATYGQSRYLLSQLRAVSLKSQIRLAPALKHSFCRRCDCPLVPGKTSQTRVSNDSWYGEKPWADVVVITCGFCGAVRRFPTAQKPSPDKVAKSV